MSQATETPDTKPLGDLLAQVFDREPPLGDGVEAVYHRAEQIRKRRLRAVIGAGAAAVVVVAAVGYGLTTVAIPRARTRQISTIAETAPVAGRADPVLDVLRTAGTAEYRVVPREPSRGAGWRQYTVVSRDGGHPHGLIEISTYMAEGGLCFPVLAQKDACARAERRGDDVEYVRYADDRDVDWQVNQTIARRLSDGRVVVVMATGERGTGSAVTGKPPLTGMQTATVATDSRVMAAFGPDERCNGPDPACPVLKVPVPIEKQED
jgi:hypothetical protein